MRRREDGVDDGGLTKAWGQDPALNPTSEGMYIYIYIHIVYI